MSKQPCAICNKQYKTRAVRCRQCGRRVCKNCSSFGWCLECDDAAQKTELGKLFRKVEQDHHSAEKDEKR